ncbi:tetratricopeptide repeat protein [Planomonospora sp. ID67723]|uniref:AfsR/SARP family transcriptional regulator n=1 Tax=Planomonospora sp. ID67723 TaxID=2738134 RepID=UPI0018C39EC8|nr:BTAD domain-containing putative transcriptional regulator [Planomonospora sp. ID67723]MBG0829051.1 tetratricopeptide repeat protein [Planomonospora sp. ID67723]
MEFRVLGALEVASEGRHLDLGGSRQQVVLAVLLLNADRPVTTERLMEAIYGDNPPATSRAQVQICVHALRRLFSANNALEVIATRPQGYALQVDDDQIDARRFENLVLKARKARDGHSFEEAVTHYRDALALWRGPALEGIESRLVQSAASRFAEQQITANEDCIQLELNLGRHHELVSELTRLVEEHPLREQLVGHLMTALYRSGRQAEALQVYRNARRTMIDELGIEPNERLQQLESAILTSDESLDPPDPPTRISVEPRLALPAVPSMLPADIADFVGRQKQIDMIRQRLTVASSGAARFAVPIVTIAGQAGIGKTTIAVRAAHSVAEHFPDGQLYADLHGGTSRPVSPMQVLERFLRALGLPGTTLPDSLDERAETYRMLLAGRRMLIMLDDATTESQVLPLLPGDPASAVIVTSRSRLGGLAGVTQVDVDLFDSVQSLDLLSHIAGAERMQSEPESSVALAELCGHLPLALRIAGARLAARPHWSVEQLTERLRDGARRLDELMHGDMGIRASLSLTYEGLSEETRRLFRRLAVLDSHVFSAWTSAALLDQPLADAQDLLDDLADAQLVDVISTGRHINTQYRFHDLIRVFARERLAAEESPAERTSALSRVLSSLLRLTQVARSREYGPSVTGHQPVPIPSPLPEELVERLVSEPITWFESERHVLLSGIRQAAQAGFVELCWQLALHAEDFFESRVYLDDWRETHEIALEAARNAGDRRGHAEMLYALGALSLTEQRFDDAQRDFQAALTLFEEVGDELKVALSIRSIAFLERMRGRLQEAASRLEKALEIFCTIGDQVSAAHALHNLAQIRVDCNDVDGAKMLLAEALVRSKSSGNRRMTAQVLHRMGEAHLQANEFALAAGAFEEALTVVLEIGDLIGEAIALHGLGTARLRQGKLEEAATLLRRALLRAQTSRHRLAEANTLAALGELAIATGRPADSISPMHQAASLFRQMRIPMREADVLITLGEASQVIGDEATMSTALSRALELTDQIDPQVGASLSERLATLHNRERQRGIRTRTAGPSLRPVPGDAAH